MSESWRGGSDTRWTRFRATLFAAWDVRGRRTCELQLDGCTRTREQVDHIVPLSKGGTKYDARNCRPACASCNRKRGAEGCAPQPAHRRVSSW